ncbi:unnamed protein product [Zymoseptoria tritici ST99CH_1A5]|uniref:Uncharacterized protein n=2 Tax=Zymoseptoria tritici TaxID=1047171 RepID=A0A1X7S7L8_ZYMT9|nr:unnamed protein product [Zymoseptoria tritici ST99CH_3D7]SMY29317.1 unnamed protein product [Zymoseptoria tritici ST99CH_1A5]
MASTALLLFGAGAVSHLAYFRNGEHHMHSVRYIQAFTAVCIASTLGLVNYNGDTVSSAITTTAFMSCTWLAGVYSSLLIYRCFFHPLNKFPGPFPARLGSLWLTSQLTDWKGYKLFQKMHKQNGRYVRVGPNTLSITDPDIMQPAYSAGSKVIKGDWYDASYPRTSMHTSRSKPLHDRRRRVWAPAFSDKAMREYETVVYDFNNKLVEKFDEHVGEPVNVSTWFNLYSFDIMGRLAFGKDYGMVEGGKRHWALDLLVEGMELTGLRMPVWLIRILMAIPGLTKGYWDFIKFCQDEVTWRVHNGKADSNDIIGWLLKAYAGEKNPDKDPMLVADTQLIIVAGSDTTSATLTFLFYYLAADPSQQEKLREELKPLINSEKWSDKDIQNAQHLNGAIDEALRLHPPVPSGLMRQTPAEGVQIGEVFIPGKVDFFTPLYPMGRDETIYEDAESFVPERWYSRSEMVKHPDAFAPFSMGPFNCIGKNLARMELRTLTATILLKYNVAFAPGEDGTMLKDKLRDHFVVSPGELNLVFTPIAT